MAPCGDVVELSRPVSRYCRGYCRGHRHVTACLVTEVLAFLKPSPKALSFGRLVLWFVISKYESMIVTLGHIKWPLHLFLSSVELLSRLSRLSSLTARRRHHMVPPECVSNVCRGVEACVEAYVEAVSRFCCRVVEARAQRARAARFP